MFKKIVSQLSFSPALVGQLGFYAKRLRKEQTTRRLGLVFVALALVVQSLTVFQAPEPANASSNNDFIVGGLGLGSNRSLNKLLGPYDRNERNLKDIFNQFGITRAEITATSFQLITVGSLKSYGYENRAGSTNIPIYNQAGSQVNTIYGRPLTIWGNSPNSQMWAYVGHSAKTGWFAILQICGNIVTPEFPKPPTPGNVVTSKKAVNVTQGNVDASKRAAKANDKITYSITSTNKGGLAKSVTIKDNLAGVVPWAKFVDYGGGIYNTATKTISWPAITLGAGQSVTKKFTIQVVPDLTSTSTSCSMKNNVLGSIVTIPVACATPANITTSKTAVNVSQGNVDATKTTARANDTITFKLTAKNSGGTAKSVSFTDDISSVLAWSTLTDNGGAKYDANKQTLSWGNINIPAGGTVTRSFSVKMISDLVTTKTNCTITNTFTGHTVTIPVGCTAPANITTNKTAMNVSHGNIDATKTKALANDKITYTLSAKNTGGVAKQVSFSDDLSDVLIFSKLTDKGGGTFDSKKQTLSWGNISVAPGATVTRSFSIQMNSSLENETINCSLTNAFYGTTVVVPVNCVLPPGQLVFSKEATNASQNAIDATKTTAHAGDRITFNLTVNNTGGQAKSTALVDTLSDALEYATLIDNGGGTFNEKTQKLSWPDVSVPAGGTVVRTFAMQVLKDIPATPSGKSDPSSYDCNIENTFEDAHVTIPVECTPPKVVENIVDELPHTGPRENMLFAGIVFAVVVYFYARSRQLGTEVRLIRRDVNGGVI